MNLCCPQCTSRYCGPLACRFSGVTNERAAAHQRENAYAAAMIRREKVEPQWERDAKTGARDK